MPKRCIDEAILAYDEEALFQAVAHHLFDNPDVPRLPERIFRESSERWEDDIADLIASIHLARFPLKEASRMKAAHKHQMAVIDHSRESWRAIEGETDDDREWIPNAKQVGVIPNVQVTQEMIDGWRSFLDEAEALLAGKKLVPHWRFSKEFGVNLHRVFQEPREFDLVLWMHGSATVPYAEKGPVTDTDTWQRLERLFGGQFIGFAFWFN